MAKNVVIREVEYDAVPCVKIPLSTDTSSYAEFYDISEATVNDNAQMLNGVVSHGSDGTKYTGSIATKTTSDVTVSGRDVTIPSGYYASQTTKSVNAGSVSAPSSVTASGASITTSSNSITLSKSDVSNIPNVSAGYVAMAISNKSTVTLTASATIVGTATITPTTSNQTIASGSYITGTQTILGDTNLVASNIISGKTIFGVAGTALVPSISQDSTTKVLTIA